MVHDKKSVGMPVRKLNNIRDRCKDLAEVYLLQDRALSNEISIPNISETICPYEVSCPCPLD